MNVCLIKYKAQICEIMFCTIRKVQVKIMLEKTIKALREMDAAVIQADATKKKTFEYIRANYSNKGELINQKIAEMDSVYNEACGNAASKVREAIETEIQEAEGKIGAIVCADVPNTFGNDLAVIQARQGKMTDYEVESYVNKYIGNYPATAALNTALAKDYAMVRMMRIAKPDKLVEELEMRKEEVNRLVSGYDPTGYIARLLRTERNPLVATAEKVQSFLDGNYMIDYNAAFIGKMPV